MGNGVFRVARPKREPSFYTNYPLGNQLTLPARFSSEGEWLVDSDENRLRVWEIDKGAKSVTLVDTLEGHTGRITAVAVSPNGEYVASAATDGTIRLWYLRPEAISTAESLLENGCDLVRRNLTWELKNRYPSPFPTP